MYLRQLHLSSVEQDHPHRDNRRGLVHYRGGDRSELEVERMAVETVSRILNISMDPVKCSTSLLPQCIAQYNVGHLSRLTQARSVKMTAARFVDVHVKLFDMR